MQGVPVCVTAEFPDGREAPVFISCACPEVDVQRATKRNADFDGALGADNDVHRGHEDHGNGPERNDGSAH